MFVGKTRNSHRALVHPGVSMFTGTPLGYRGKNADGIGGRLAIWQLDPRGLLTHGPDGEGSSRTEKAIIKLTNAL